MHDDKTLSSSATLHCRSPTVSEAERRPYDLIINQCNCFCIEVRPQWTQRFLCRNCGPGLITTADMAVVNHRHPATEGRHITAQFLRTAETFGPVNTVVWLKVSTGKTILIPLMMVLTQGHHSCSLKDESRHVFWIAPNKILLPKMDINDKLNRIGLFFFNGFKSYLSTHLFSSVRFNSRLCPKQCFTAIFSHSSNSTSILYSCF